MGKNSVREVMLVGRVFVGSAERTACMSCSENEKYASQCQHATLCNPGQVGRSVYSPTFFFHHRVYSSIWMTYMLFLITFNRSACIISLWTLKPTKLEFI